LGLGVSEVEGVDQAEQQLAGAALHLGIELAVELRELEVAPAEHPREIAVLANDPVVVAGLDDRHEQIFACPGLGQESEHAGAVDRRERDLDVGVAGHQDAHGVGRAPPHSLAQLDAVHVRHAVVGDQRGVVVLAQQIERLRAALGQIDLAARIAQRALGRLEQHGVVVHDEDPRHEGLADRAQFLTIDRRPMGAARSSRRLLFRHR
jgi:hypothetical protein